MHDITTINDINELIKNKQIEDDKIDYKLFLDVKKEDFLNDICAFANTHGGWLIYGVDEKNGIPQSTQPIEIKDKDTYKQTINNRITSKIEPYVKYEVSLIESNKNEPDKFIVVIKINESMKKPIRVRGGVFYGRMSGQNYHLSLEEIENMIKDNNIKKDEIKDYLDNRLKNFKNNFHNGVLIDIIPVDYFNNKEKLSIKELKIENFPEIYSQPRHLPKCNIDGKYVQGDRMRGEFFKNGVVEISDSEFFNKDERDNIPYITLENGILNFIRKVIDIYKNNKIKSRVIVSIRFVNTREFKIPSQYLFFNNEEIEKDEIIFDNIIIDDLNKISTEENSIDIEKILKPVLDIYWNACGKEEDEYLKEKIINKSRILTISQIPKNNLQ